MPASESWQGGCRCPGCDPQAGAVGSSPSGSPTVPHSSLLGGGEPGSWPHNLRKWLRPPAALKDGTKERGHGAPSTSEPLPLAKSGNWPRPAVRPLGEQDGQHPGTGTGRVGAHGTHRCAQVCRDQLPLSRPTVRIGAPSPKSLTRWSLWHVGMRGVRVPEPKPCCDPWPHRAQGSCISWAWGGVGGVTGPKGSRVGSAQLWLQCLAGPWCPTARHGHCHQEAAPPREEGRASRVQDMILLPGAARTPGHRVPEAPQVQLAGKWDCQAETCRIKWPGASGHFGGWISCFSHRSFKWFSWL